MKRLIIAVAIAGVVLVGAIISTPVARGDSVRAHANSMAFADSIGEDLAGPDITGVTVSNDDAGLTTFQIAISNRPALTQDMLLVIFLDTDRNAATGDKDANGADYVIQLVPGEVDLLKWGGSDYDITPAQTSLTYAYAATGATIRVGTSDLGKTKGFGFDVIALSGVTIDAQGQPDFTNVHRDSAPDPGHGFYAYTVVTKLTVTVVGVTTSPKPVRAGRSIAVGLAATESDTKAAVASGKVTCKARIAATPLRARKSVLANGVAVCTWTIPKSAKGKSIRGTITLTTQGVSVTRPFSSPIT